MSDSVDLSDIVDDFVADSLDCLDQFERDIKALELRPSDADLLNSAFRSVHSIKGTSGFMGFRDVEVLAHAGENLLAAMRDGDTVFDGSIGPSLARMSEVMRELLAAIKATAGDTGIDIAPLCAELERLNSAPSERERSVTEVASRQRVVTRGVGDDRSNDAVRIEIGTFDRLIDLASELASVAGPLAAGRSVAGDDSGRIIARVAALSGDLYSTLMDARLQALNGLWRHAQRIARDLAAECGKSIEVVAEHAGMHLDKRLLEVLADPLIHMIRNAVDHGIEPPEQRLAQGKRAHGTLQLRARLCAGQIMIEVGDDGAGIDRDRVRRTARRQGIATADQLAGMSDAELLRLVFQPGLSTTDRITKLSGRGVGMDVVRTKIAQLGGEVELDSWNGVGTTVRMHFPLTIAMLPILTLHRGDQRFAVAHCTLVECIDLQGGRHRFGPRYSGGRMLRLGDEQIPLVGLPETPGPEETGLPTRAIIVDIGEQRYAVLADGVSETGPVVIRATHGSSVGSPALAATTEDGPILLLDLPSLAVQPPQMIPGEEPLGR